MNYMKQVAEMLGVELNEEFMIAVDGEKSDRKYKLTETGCCVYKPHGEWYHTEAINRILSGIYEIVKIPKPILDNAEKEYLSAVIKPFKDRVKYLSKNRFDGFERIFITYFSKLGSKDYILDLPAFEEGTMYKGMDVCKHYTLEELGL